MAILMRVATSIDLTMRFQATQKRVLAAICFLLLYNLIASEFFDIPVNESHHLASATQLLGLMAIASLVRDVNSDCLLRQWDFRALIIAAIALAIPTHFAGAVGATVIGAFFVPRKDFRLSSIGQLCLGLAWIDCWGPLAFKLVEEWLLPLETALAFVPLSVLTPDTLDGTVISNGAGHDIRIVEGCSAFHNTISTTFIWLCLLKIQRLHIGRRQITVLALAVLSVVLLNTARIGLLAISEPLFEYWHEGFGFYIAKITMLGTVLTIFYFGMSPLSDPANRRAGPIAKLNMAKSRTRPSI